MYRLKLGLCASKYRSFSAGHIKSIQERFPVHFGSYDAFNNGFINAHSACHCLLFFWHLPANCPQATTGSGSPVILYTDE